MIHLFKIYFVFVVTVIMCPRIHADNIETASAASVTVEQDDFSATTEAMIEVTDETRTDQDSTITEEGTTTTVEETTTTTEEPQEGKLLTIAALASTTAQAKCTVDQLWAEQIIDRLTIYWNVTDPDVCNLTIARARLIDMNCEENCAKMFEGNESNINNCINTNCTETTLFPIMNSTYTFRRDLIPCVNYRYQIIKSNEILRNSTIRANQKYQKVEDLFAYTELVSRNENEIELIVYWEYRYVECPQMFVVFVSYDVPGNDIPRPHVERTTNYTHTVKFIEACTNITITVFPEIESSSEDYNNTYELITRRVNPSNLTNLQLVNEDNYLRVRWDRPQYGKFCIRNYIVTAESDFDEFKTVTVNGTDNSGDIRNVFACGTYNITVTTYSPIENSIEAVREDFEETTPDLDTTTVTTTTYPSFNGTYLKEASISEMYTTEARAFPPPTPAILINRSNSSLTLNTTVNEARNLCGIKEYRFTCAYNDTVQHSEVSSYAEKTLGGLKPYTMYSCTVSVSNNVSIWSDESEPTLQRTAEAQPDPPKVSIDSDTITPTSFLISWATPDTINGNLIEYKIQIKFSSFTYFNPDYCQSFEGSIIYNTTDPDTLSYEFDGALPSAEYSIQVQARNEGIDGQYSNAVYVTTPAAKSEIVQNLTVIENQVEINEPYSTKTTVEWRYPCKANGNITKFYLRFIPLQAPEEQSRALRTINVEPLQTDYSFEEDSLVPDVYYSIEISAISEISNGEVEGEVKVYERNYTVTPGLPEVNKTSALLHNIVKNVDTKTVLLAIPADIFNSNVGSITRIVLIIGQTNCPDSPLEREIGFGSGPTLLTYRQATEESCIPQYQTGEIQRDVALNAKGNTFSFSIGSACDTSNYCNGPLNPDTHYKLTFRLHTRTGYADTDFIGFKTNKEVPLLIITISILSALCIVFVIGFYISCRRTRALRKNVTDFPYDRADIGVHDFPRYYKEISNNDNDKIKDEFKAIQFFSDNLEKTCIASKANERLNRYTNISPYDNNRVVLNYDEFENDYINASYINGYRYPKEYIAAQGPKPNTAFDFWRMVLQHKTESVVMLTSLVENNKVKCHEYFPKLTGRIDFDNIHIVCIAEQKFPTYVKRILEVEKEGEDKHKLNHYYFTKWPDHSCPNNASDLINFVKTIRNERLRPADTFIVHCSAGVGRTGTFIALDIMMQKLKVEKKINIFDLVKNLRLQRMKMVQTPDQYTFLYTAALELSSDNRQPKFFQNISLFIEEFELLKRWKKRANSTEKVNIVKTDDKESPL